MEDYVINEDKTVFMPMAPTEATDVMAAQGADFTASQQATDSTPQPLEATSHIVRLNQLGGLSGPNDLLENATEIFALHYQLIHGTLNSQLDRLRSLLNDALVKFELRCQQHGMTKPLTKSAKYALCAFMDETILSAEWSKDIAWSNQSLLSHFFNETWGGETFFKIRQFCIENLNEYIQLLELVYVCLCLGFRGKFAVQNDGDIQLDRIKRETYQIIREYRGDLFNQDLSKRWQSDYSGKKTLKQYQSLWIALGISLAVLIVTYSGLSFFLNKSSEPVTQQVSTLMEKSAK